MIFPMTRMAVVDNSGARVAMCIGILGHPQGVARAGRLLTVTIKDAKANSKVRQGTIHKALLVRCKKEAPRGDGRWIRFDDNAVVLLGPDLKPLGTRVSGPVDSALKMGNWLKVLSLSNRVI